MRRGAKKRQKIARAEVDFADECLEIGCFLDLIFKNFRKISAGESCHQADRPENYTHHNLECSQSLNDCYFIIRCAAACF